MTPMSETPAAHDQLDLRWIAAAGVGIVMALGASAVMTNVLASSAVASPAPTTETAVPLPPAYTTATCASTAGTSVHVSWTPVTAATRYAVYEATSSGSGPYHVVAGRVSATTWTSGDLDNGHHWFEVAAGVGSDPLGSPSSPTGETRVQNGSRRCVGS
jgi:hypothetical protein